MIYLEAIYGLQITNIFERNRLYDNYLGELTERYFGVSITNIFERKEQWDNYLVILRDLGMVNLLLIFLKGKEKFGGEKGDTTDTTIFYNNERGEK